MTDEKILEVVLIYRELIEKNNVAKSQYPRDEILRSPECVLSLAHCLYMLDRIEEFVSQGRREKAFRWLGFVQGVLFVNKIFTIDDLANHNRPPES